MDLNPHKSFGQHFLNDPNTARRIVDALSGHMGYTELLEVGPGTGALTALLIEEKKFRYHGIEIDRRAADILLQKFPEADIRCGDFLKYSLSSFTAKPFGLIGNFPYNISSQILFRILDYRQRIPEVVGMFQREVAARIASGPGSKQYGILSVLTAAYYEVEKLFEVSEKVFVPRPKVQSALIRLKRNPNKDPDCDPSLFASIVKTAFGQRRKMLKNALCPFRLPREHPLLAQRAEQLDVPSFAELTRLAKQAP